MTITEQANLIRDALADWSKDHGGKARIASGPAQMIEMLSTKPGGVFVGVMLDTEDPRGDFSDLGRVDRHWKVVVSCGKGFRLETGEELTLGAGGGAPLYDMIEEAREVVRNLKFDGRTTEIIPDYKGIAIWDVQGFILDAFEIRFSIGTQIPFIDQTQDA